MNTANIKKYAPKARIDFQKAIKARANKLGIYADHIEPLSVTGDVMQIGDKQFPTSQKSQRDALERQINQDGFEAVMDLAASTWFNRLCAIRFMELKGYLDHGYRVLSHPELANGFQILEHAADVAEELGLNRAEVLELTLQGDNEEELYRSLLLAQCNSLHDSMDFLFERIDDVSALLLPDGLTRTDSILRPLVDNVPEEDWSQVEIIGWLYQFYISEKKDEVIGKVVKSEDIPAATQLFTPNWIVQYLVQNSVGRQWLQTYPDSSIKANMPYYIEPAEQSDEVNAQLAEITPDTLEPESIKVLDPACGSGHILVEAYNTLKAIYDERGYKAREIPKLILENNLYGLDIDDRAAQLAGFALMMMAREDDRRIFSRGVKLNVLSLQETAHLDIPKLWHDLDLAGDWSQGISADLFGSEQASFNAPQANDQYRLLLDIQKRFQQTKTLGSLVEVPAEQQVELKALLDTLLNKAEDGDTAQRPAAKILIPFVQQAWILSLRYDSIVANPPYMGSKGMNVDLKNFAKVHYPNSKSDLFAMFMERGFKWLDSAGYNAMVTMQSWMFLASYEELREYFLDHNTLLSMTHMGNGVMKIAFGTSASIFQKKVLPRYKGHFSYCDNKDITPEGTPREFPVKNERLSIVDSSTFKKIQSSPIAYWVPKQVISLFEHESLKDYTHSQGSVKTGNNDLFTRYHWEVSTGDIGENNCWRMHPRGGEYRKWFGNVVEVVNWSELARKHYRKDNVARIPEEKYWGLEGICWSEITSGSSSFRLLGAKEIANNKSLTIYPNNQEDLLLLLCFLNSKIVDQFLGYLNPTVGVGVGDVLRLPWVFDGSEQVLLKKYATSLVESYKLDWDQFERSPDFKRSPICPEVNSHNERLQHSFASWKHWCIELSEISCSVEASINKIVYKYCNLEDEPFSIPLEQVSLTVNNVYRYGVNLPDRIRDEKFRSDSIAELLAYVIGCMMGRYSLDREGLVYAHAGNEGFTELENEGAYRTFPADDDGIIPLTDLEWFSDDATYRFRDFVRTVWGEEHLQENLDFVAESLCLHAIKPKRSESSLETIRRYLSTQFYKDHLKTYKKRPIYWLFSSGKQKAFECLVYLHRYNEGTLSRMRTEYVTPLIGKYDARLSQLEQQLDSASTSEQTKLKKEISTLEQKQSELRTFDDKLKHRADMRIKLDLDDGVKVNYGKFGDLLAEVKSIHG